MLDDEVVGIQPLIPYAISLELYRAPGNKGSIDIVRQTFWTCIEPSEGDNLFVGDNILQILGDMVQGHGLEAWAASLVFLKWTLRLEPLALADLVALSGSIA